VTHDDVIDVRDLIDRFEDLDADHDGDTAPAGEYEALRDLLDELRDRGGDIRWRGGWYPATLLREPQASTDYTSVDFDGVTYWYRG
jgi:hypothetical protein